MRMMPLEEARRRVEDGTFTRAWLDDLLPRWRRSMELAVLWHKHLGWSDAIGYQCASIDIAVRNGLKPPAEGEAEKAALLAQPKPPRPDEPVDYDALRVDGYGLDMPVVSRISVALGGARLLPAKAQPTPDEYVHMMPGITLVERPATDAHLPSRELAGAVEWVARAGAGWGSFFAGEPLVLVRTREDAVWGHPERFYDVRRSHAWCWVGSGPPVHGFTRYGRRPTPRSRLYHAIHRWELAPE